MDWTPEEIRALRKRLGYNQTQMAEALGYSRYQSVSELEHGKLTPSSSVLRLLDHLRLHGDILDRKIEPPVNEEDAR